MDARLDAAATRLWQGQCAWLTFTGLESSIEGASIRFELKNGVSQGRLVIRASALSRLSPEKLLLYQVGLSALVLPALSLMLGEQWGFQWSAFAVGSLALQTVVGAFASYLAWMWLLGRYPAAKMGTFVFLTPVFALLFGALWLHEPVTLNLLLALALVGVGIVLVNKK